MAYVVVYTRTGEEYYNSGNSENYKGLVAKNCDVFHAVHLALSYDGVHFTPMRNNTGILFPKAEFSEEISKETLQQTIGGITKTLRDPWVFRYQDGSFGICAVRWNENKPDQKTTGHTMLFQSKDLIRFREVGFLKLSDEEIRHPRCQWDARKSGYYMEWETSQGIYSGCTKDFLNIENVQICKEVLLKSADIGDIKDAVFGNILEISEEEAKKIEMYLGEIKNIGVKDIQINIAAGQKPEFETLPKAVCLYNDGSVHEKFVCWDKEAFEKIDFTKSGEYEISGEICQKHYPFPFFKTGMSDPCICQYQGKFFLSASGQRSVTFRISDTLEGLADVKPVNVYTMPETDKIHANMWAQEMHVIHGVPYVFTTVGEKEWYTVRSHILRCNGNPENPADWEAPRLVVRPDGTELQPEGISLDMTYFCIDEIHYVMWSDRKFAERSEKRVIADSADIYIATIDPDRPWQLTSEPVCILRPMYGWDRYETEVDEGPYLLQHGSDLFVTISGSSTGLADLYCLGLLHAKETDNLLLPESWDWLPYPVLTKESVAGEYGPGHNSFIKDLDSGDDLLIYHAVPHDENEKTLGRYMGIRRVHWAANGYPYLEMTEERDLNPEFKKVNLKIIIHNCN